MAELSKDLALRTKRVVERAEQEGGETGSITDTRQVPRRQARYCKTPADGIPDPPSGTGDMLSSAMCTLMKINSVGDALEETNTEEKIYSRFSIAGETIIEVKQINGRPFAGLTQTVKIGKADSDIQTGATGSISVWRDGSDTGEDVNAVLDWMHGEEKVSSGKQVVVQFFEDENIWRIVGAECED